MNLKDLFAKGKLVRPAILMPPRPSDGAFHRVVEEGQPVGRAMTPQELRQTIRLGLGLEPLREWDE